MSKKVTLLALLIIAAFNSALAFDFYAVCSTGQTLYYTITNPSLHYVEVSCPGNYSWDGYTKPTGHLSIPSSVSHSGMTYSVKAVGNYAFYDCGGITELTLPNSIVSIGTYAFFLNSLSSLTIPSSVTRIDQGAFASWYLTNIVFPNSLVEVGEDAFGNDDNTPWYQNQPDGLVYTGSVLYCYKGTMPSNTNISIQSGTKGIAAAAFQTCSNMTSITFPNTLQCIGRNAFNACTGLTTVTIPSSVTKINEGAFSNCGYLTTVNYNAQNCYTQSNMTYYWPFYGCYSFSTLNIGNGVQRIPANLFRNCDHLTGTLTLPSSIKRVGDNAFSGCSSFSGNLTIPSSMDTLGFWCFQGCSGITSITYNATNCYNEISNYPFTSCSSVSSITIGSNVQTIPDCIFGGCSSISGSLVIPNSVTSIGTFAFYNCSGITSVSLGTGLSQIGQNAFSGTTGLQSITLNSTCCHAEGSWVFTGQQIHSLTIGNNVQFIPEGFLYNCPALTSQITLPNSLTAIGSMTFYSCGITGTLTIPQSVTSIGNGAFTLCSGLSQIQALPTTPPQCGETGFYGCYNKPLIVPCGCVSAYQNASLWSYFTNIQEGSGCTHQISVSANPSNGGSVSGGGIYNSGANCTVTATPNSNYSFVNWTENGTPVSSNASYSFVVNDDRTLTANFQYQQPSTYTITVSANPNNGGTVSGGGIYQQGQQCTVSATANSNYTFVNWTENGTQVSTNPTYSFTVNGNRTLVAHFQNIPNQYTISLSANPTNGGTVSGGGTYSQGQTCTVTANANPSYSFVNWTENGTQVSTNSTYSFTVTGNRTLVANFSYSPTGYVINATAEPSYGGLVSGAGTYNQGQTCTLIATPNPNYDFANWTESGNVVSTTPTYSFTVNGNRTLVAHFESQVYTINVSSIPSDGGTIYGGGVYSAGITCHLIAVPNNNYSFLNWTENGVVVSSDSDYSFVVTGNRTLVANFVFYDSLEEDATNDINIYPNPVKDILYMEGVNFDKIEIFNVTGQLLLSQEPSNSTVELNLRHLPSGIYLVKVYWNGGVVCHRLVKE